MDSFLRRQHSQEKDSICQREQGHKRKKKTTNLISILQFLVLKCQLPHRKEQFGLCAVTIAISSQGHQFREAHGPAALIIRVTSECWIWIFDSGSSFEVIAAPIHGMKGPQFFCFVLLLFTLSLPYPVQVYASCVSALGINDLKLHFLAKKHNKFCISKDILLFCHEDLPNISSKMVVDIFSQFQLLSQNIISVVDKKQQKFGLQ